MSGNWAGKGSRCDGDDEVTHIIEIIKDDIRRIAASTDTTVEDVTNSIEKLSGSTQRIDFRSVASGLESLNFAIEEQKRKQKAIDRIAWKAEAAQRRAKGMHFK
jgi:hypothetical protein